MSVLKNVPIYKTLRMCTGRIIINRNNHLLFPYSESESTFGFPLLYPDMVKGNATIRYSLPFIMIHISKSDPFATEQKKHFWCWRKGWCASCYSSSYFKREDESWLVTGASLLLPILQSLHTVQSPRSERCWSESHER